MDILSLQADSPLAYAFAFFLGAHLHVALFRFGEWDLWVPKLLFMFFTTYFALIYYFVFHLPLDSDNIFAAIANASNLLLILLGGIYTSAAVYRIFLHPLRRFPGPFLARLTNAYATSLLIKKYHPYKEIQLLHQAYGDIVRLGQCEFLASGLQLVANTTNYRTV